MRDRGRPLRRARGFLPIHAAEEPTGRGLRAAPGIALLALGAALVLLTFVAPIGEDVRVVWINETIPDVRSLVFEIPADASGRPVFLLQDLRLTGAGNATVAFNRTADGFIETVNLAGLDADPGATLAFEGRTSNRVPDGTYAWEATSTDALNRTQTSSGNTTTTTTVVESISWFFLENPAYLVVPFILGGLLLAGPFECPDECEPEGAKKGCTSELWTETYPCGSSPGDIKDVRTGAQIMAWAASRARKLPVLGATYAEFLKAMPGFADMAKGLTEKSVGKEVYVTVVCRWQACRTRNCWVFWSRRKWVGEGTAYGPFKVKPPSGFYTGNADCFGPGLTSEQFYEGLKKAIEGSEEIEDAKAKCEAHCK